MATFLSGFLLPIADSRLVERHKVDLRGAPSLGRRKEYLVVPLAKELQLLRFFVHENAVQVTGVHVADLDRLVAPTHDLVGGDVG